jgi:hypothetical protein
LPITFKASLRTALQDDKDCRVERRVTPAPPHGTRRADFPHRALRTSSPEQGRVARNHRDMGLGLCVPAMRGLTIRWSVGPFPPRALPRFPGTMGRSDSRHPHVWLGITLPATPPATVTGPMAGSPGFRTLPVPACPARRGMDARSLSPWRATATAFPAVAYGSASTVLGISGLVPFTPAVCGFRPTEFLSTLRPGRSPAQTQDSVPATRWLARSPVGLPTHRADAQVTHWEAPAYPGARNVPFSVPFSDLPSG